jgi:hypothetical protein
VYCRSFVITPNLCLPSIVDTAFSCFSYVHWLYYVTGFVNKFSWPPYLLGITGVENPLESSGFVDKLFRDYGLLWLSEVEIPVGSRT